MGGRGRGGGGRVWCKVDDRFVYLESVSISRRDNECPFSQGRRQKASTLKGKNLVTLAANSFL